MRVDLISLLPTKTGIGRYTISSAKRQLSSSTAVVIGFEELKREIRKTDTKYFGTEIVGKMHQPFFMGSDSIREERTLRRKACVVLLWDNQLQ